MSTPFRSLSPFAPRFFEFNYIAAAPQCCDPAEVDAGPDFFQQIDVLGRNTEILLHGTVTNDGEDVSSGGLVMWSKLSGPGSVIFDHINQPDTTAQLPGQVGPYSLRLTFDSPGGASDDDATIYAQRYELGTEQLIGWTTPIDGVDPKPVFIIWILNSDQDRQPIAVIDYTFFGEPGDPTPEHVGHTLAFGEFQAGNGFRWSQVGRTPTSNPEQRFFVSLVYNIPDGEGGEITVEKPAEIELLLDPAYQDDPPFESGPGVTLTDIPRDESGTPTFATASPIAPSVVTNWIPNPPARGFKTSDFRVAQALLRIAPFEFTQS